MNPSEELLEGILDATPFPMVVTRVSSGEVLLCNELYARMMGADPEELVGRNISDFYVNPAVRQQYIQTLRREGVVTNEELEVKTTQGAIIRVAVSIRHLKLDGEDITLAGLRDMTQRVKAEEGLRWFKTTLDQTRDCVFIFRPGDLRFTYVNRGAVRHVGYSEAELMTMTPLHIKPAFTELSFRDWIAPLVAGELADLQFETVHRHKDGRDIPVEVLLQYIAPENEEPRFVAVVRDITERKSNEIRLYESRRRYRNLVEGSIQGIAIIQDYILKFANDSLAKTYGYDHPGELIGCNTLEVFIAPHERERIQAMHQSRMRGEPVPDRYEFQGLHKDGSMIWLEGQARAVEWEGRSAAQVTYQDITERRQAEERLRAGERLLQTVFDSIPHWMYVKDLDSRYLMVNEAMAGSFGLPKAEFIGQSTRTFRARVVHPIGNPEEVQALVEMDRQVYETGGLVENPAQTLTTGEGTRRIHHIIKLPFRNDAGEIVGLVGISQDVTTRIMGEEELRRNRALLASVFDALPHPLQVKDRELRYLLVNQATADLYHTKKEDWVGMHTLEVEGLSEGVRESLYALDREAMDREMMVRQSDVPVKFKNGRLGYYNIIKEPMRDDTGQIVGLISIGVDVTERKLAEEALLRSRERLEDAIESIPDGFALYDAEDRLAVFNHSYRMAYPKHSEAFEIGARFEDLLRIGVERGEYPEAVGREEAWIAERVAAHTNPKGPIEQYVSDGRWLRVQEKRTREGGIVGLRTDITQIKRSEEELRRREAWLRMLLANAPVIFFALDSEGVFTLSEGRELAVLGRQPGEVVGQSAWEVYKNNPDRIAMLRRAMAGEAVDAEVLVDGHWFRARHRPLFDDDGKVSGVMVVSTNITARKSAEDRLRASETRLRQAVDIAGLGTWELMLVNNVLEWSEETSRIFGYSPGQTSGTYEKYLEQLSPEDADKVRAAVSLALQETSPFMVEHAIRRPDGRRRVVQQMGEVLRDDQGRPVKLTGIVYDITERVRMEQELRQGQKMQAVGQLAGGVAHDFNNMLQIVQGYAELIENNARDSARVRDWAEKILGVAQSAANITRQLLTFSRKKILQKRVLDLREAIADLEELLLRTLGADIDLEIQASSTPAYIYADTELLEQILLNLAINARDAMPDGGQLTINTDVVDSESLGDWLPGGTWAGHAVRLRVSDTGCGISEEVLEQVFEPFFTTKEMGKGTGLGLSTVYTIVEQLEGRIHVESEEGRGTTFILHFPLQPAAEIVQPAVRKAALPRGRGTILFAEDEDQVRDLMVNALRSHGYQVLIATNGEEALALFHSHGKELHLVVLDAVMPKLGGRDVFEVIRRDSPRLPVLFSTGYSVEILESEVLEQEHTGLLQKPYSVNDLLERVQAMLTSVRGDDQAS